MRPLLLALLGATLVIPAAFAGKKGGGGGEPAPTGTIYYWADGETFGIEADGTGNSGAPRGYPTHLLHDGSRWFADFVDGAGANPDGSTTNVLVARRDDGYEVTLAAVALVSGRGYESTLVRWAPDDSSVSYIGLSWTGSGAWDAQSHVFRADVDWNTGEPVLDAFEAVVTTDLSESDGFPWSDIDVSDWAPDGDRVAYEQDGEILVKTVSTGATASLGTGREPEWSPDLDPGTAGYQGRIAFALWSRDSSSHGIYTMRPDGSDVFRVTKGPKGGGDRMPRWSPDGAHLAIHRATFSGSDVARVPAAGGTVVVLTGGVTADWKSPTAWR